MPTDPRKRQKKQERRAAKRKVKHHQLSKERHTGLAERLKAAAGAPVLHSWVSTTLWDEGLGSVLLSRALPTGSVAFAVFLVDRYCLGVKDAWADIGSRSRYDSEIVRKTRATFEVREMSPAAVRKLVEGAVEYARGLGLHPHPDYQKARLIFGDIDAGESTETFEYGKDGKPFFVGGPHDTPERCRQIVNTLTQTCGGPDGFHYLIPLGGQEEFQMIDEDEEEPSWADTIEDDDEEEG
jgi:hypothetical protein